MATRFDYRRQALTYDRTRAASPSVLGPLRAALGPAAGRLVDVGGGTGNYSLALAEHGWQPVVVDRSPDMLARARAKGLAVAVGDASALPVPDGAVDAVALISMLHHVPDWSAALEAARAAVRPGGTVVVMSFTREHLEVHWIFRYLPAALAHFAGVHQTGAELLAALPGAEVLPVRYADLVDGSMAALCRRPDLLLDPARRAQTSIFEWAEDHAPDETRDGFVRLEADLAAGRRPQDEAAELRDRLGDASVIAWRRPPPLTRHPPHPTANCHHERAQGPLRVAVPQRRRSGGWRGRGRAPERWVRSAAVEPVESLSLAQARRIALAAQGFTDERLGARGRRVDRRHLHRVLDRVDVVQIDSVNVLVRTQEMPLFSRLGPHPRDLWTRAAADGEVFEAWCHEASLLPVDHWPLLAWKREEDAAQMWRSTRAIAHERPGYLDEVEAQVRERGPVRASDLDDPGSRKQGMWERSDGKRALEYLFSTGRLAARRDPTTFTRLYDTVERSIPERVRSRPAPPAHDARKALLERAARAHGVGTDRCLADYHRLHLPSSRALLAELVEEGRLRPVEVRGWDRPAYLHPEAPRPRRVRARALLSPFDSLVWERRRTEELFGFRYRIEIYVRPEERVHGYYVLPFLLGDRLVARVDLKADRAVGVLRVQAAHAEPGEDEGEVAAALAEELHLMAGWLALDRVAVEPRGDLAPTLRRAVG